MTARHHTVPQFYLRHFADAAGRVRLVDRDDPTRSHVTSVRNAAAETGFYRIERDDLERPEDRDGFDPESIERALSGLEDAFAPAVLKLVEGRYGDIGDQDWYRLTQFVAFQTVRGNQWREDFTALLTQAVRVSVLSGDVAGRVRSHLADLGRPNGPADVADFVDKLASGTFPTIVPPRAVLVQESLRMALGDPGADEPEARRGVWGHVIGKKPALVLPRHTPVLTSDEPVCWWSPGDGPVGHATAQVVWLPISPRLLLQFSDPDFDAASAGLPDAKRRDDHDELASRVNVAVAAQAERWIIHHPDDRPLEGVALPPREVWGDQLVSVEENDEERRELYVHRRMPSAEPPERPVRANY